MSLSPDTLGDPTAAEFARVYFTTLFGTGVLGLCITFGAGVASFLNLVSAPAVATVATVSMSLVFAGIGVDLYSDIRGLEGTVHERESSALDADDVEEVSA